MSHPIYVNGKPILGHITYLCPKCEEQLHRGQKCPHCQKTAIGRDLIAESEARVNYYQEPENER